MGADHACNLFCEGCWIGDFWAFNNEGLEFIVTMCVFMIMMMIVIVVIVFIVVVMVVVDFVAGIEIVFGTDALAEQHIHRQGAHGGFDHLNAVAAFGFEFADEGCAFICA